MEIRKVDLADIGTYRRLVGQLIALQGPIRMAQWEDRYTDEFLHQEVGSESRIAIWCGTPIAYIGLYQYGGDLYPGNFIVDRVYRGQGFGSMIIDHLKHSVHGTRVTLLVRQGNAPAIRLYKLAGFRIVGQCDLGADDRCWRMSYTHA
jgi:RimJ/RimL family protein N-acetyltransferase